MRPDKNKGGNRDEKLARSLEALQHELDRTLLFLAAYQRSTHPERREALRWLLPVLRARATEIRSNCRPDP